MSPRHPSWFLLVTVLAGVAGCIEPGEMSDRALVRYQQAMAERATRPHATAGALGPAEVAALTPFDVDPLVEHVVKTTVRYEGTIAPDGALPRDRARTTVVVTEFDLDPEANKPDPKTARIVRRTETRTTRTFAPPKAPGRTGRPAAGILTKTIDQQTVSVLDAKTGQLASAGETVSTSTYKKVAPKAGGSGPANEGDVEVRTTVRTTGAPAAPTSQPAEPAETVRRISVWEFESLAAPPKNATTTRSIRVGKKNHAPALLENSRRMVSLSLREAILGALATNLDIHVVSFEPAISREEMTQAAAVFDAAVFADMKFFKIEDEDDSPLGLYDDVQRSRSWTAGVRQLTPTGGSWALRAALSRNWDDSEMDGLYKTVAALEVTQPLLRGAWPAYNLARLRIARLDSQASDAQFRAEVERVITEVAVAYWDLVRARREMEIKQALLEVTRGTFEHVKARRGFDATQAAVKQVEVALRERTAELIDARREIGDTQAILVHLIPAEAVKGPPVTEITPTTAPLEKHLRLAPGEQLLTAVRHNPLLEEARLGIAAAKIEIAVAENETLPTLNLSAAVASQDFRGSLMRPGHDYTDGDCVMGYQFDLLLDYPIGNRAAMARLRQTEFERAQKIAEMQKTINDLALEISERIRKMDRAYEKALAYRRVAKTADAHLHALAEGEELRGRLTPGFLRTKLRAQRNAAQARERAEQAIFSYNSARAELNCTTGTALKLHRVEIALPAAIGRARPKPAPSPPAPKKPTKKP